MRVHPLTAISLAVAAALACVSCGAFHDTLRWPARSLGIRLTFRALVTTPLGTRRLDYPVEVRR